MPGSVTDQKSPVAAPLVAKKTSDDAKKLFAAAEQDFKNKKYTAAKEKIKTYLANYKSQYTANEKKIALTLLVNCLYLNGEYLEALYQSGIAFANWPEENFLPKPRVTSPMDKFPFSPKNEEQWEHRLFNRLLIDLLKPHDWIEIKNKLQTHQNNTSAFIASLEVFFKLKDKESSAKANLIDLFVFFIERNPKPEINTHIYKNLSDECKRFLIAQLEMIMVDPNLEPKRKAGLTNMVAVLDASLTTPREVLQQPTVKDHFVAHNTSSHTTDSTLSISSASQAFNNSSDSKYSTATSSPANSNVAAGKSPLSETATGVKYSSPLTPAVTPLYRCVPVPTLTSPHQRAKSRAENGGVAAACVTSTMSQTSNTIIPPGSPPKLIL